MNGKSILFVGAAVVSTAALAVPTEARRAECERQAAQLVSQMNGEERLNQLMMDAPAIPRLGVEKYHWWNEALHGVARAGLATVFPQSIGIAASFDAELQRQVGDAVSTEARAKYNLYSSIGDRRIYRGLTLWSPNVNMFRDPRWGRGQETFGEDPYLSGVMGTAYVRGLQGDDPSFLKTSACAKHFAVHSGPEKLRHGFDAKVSARDMAEYYLPAFRMLVEEGRVESVMGAYSAINGTPCCANKWLLTDLLRGEWGFRGHVVSDVGAVKDIFGGHHFAKDRAEACTKAIAAGLDLCSEGTYNHLRDGVKSGAVDPDIFLPPLTHLFTTRALLGQLGGAKTPWDGLGARDVASRRHRQLALRMAEKSLVLVKNDGALPLATDRPLCVGVCGPRALDESALLGNYCGYSANPVSCLSGMAREAGPAVRVTTDPELNDFDVLVACMGITADDEGEEGGSMNNSGGDRVEYGVSKAQLDLLRSYRDRTKGKKLVTVVFGGSPVDLKPLCELSDAVILAWYPGEQGGRAIARAIFGKTNAFGRLPMTYPQSYDDLPDFASYALEGRTYRYATKKPAFPFGYGLSYTTYAYANAAVEKKDGKTVVSVDVTNTGKLDGEEVAQLYVRAPASAKDRRVHHLEGFRRVALKAGETKRVSFTLGELSLSVYGEDGRASVPPGESVVFVGGGQPGFADNVVSVAVSR